MKSKSCAGTSWDRPGSRLNSRQKDGRGEGRGRESPSSPADFLGYKHKAQCNESPSNRIRWHGSKEPSKTTPRGGEGWEPRQDGKGSLNWIIYFQKCSFYSSQGSKTLDGPVMFEVCYFWKLL